MTQCADFASRDGYFPQVEELDVRYWAPVELVQNLRSRRALDLISVESAHNGDVPNNGPLVPLDGHLISTGLSMVLNPVVHGGPADENKFVLVHMKENPVADYISIVITRNKLLGFIDREIRKTIDPGGGE